MIAEFKSELRKLLTVRSTYFLFLASFLLAVGLIGFWIYGFKNVEHANISADALTKCIYTAGVPMSVFFSFFAVLLIGHEYRYNTIMYSLTSVNKRTKVYLAKYFALVLLGTLAATAIVACVMAAFTIGLRVHHIHPLTQNLPVWDLVWRTALNVIGSITYAFIITFSLRSLISSIAVVLLLPSTIEGLLVLLLKGNVKYLPYTALNNAVTVPLKIDLTFSLLVVAAYVVGFGLLSYILFLKRDAN